MCKCICVCVARNMCFNECFSVMLCMLFLLLLLFFYSALYFIPPTHHCVTMINYSWKSVYHLVSVYFFFDVVVSWLLNNSFATVVIVIMLPSRFGFWPSITVESICLPQSVGAGCCCYSSILYTHIHKLIHILICGVQFRVFAI